jgi:hypothetical protein
MRQKKAAWMGHGAMARWTETNAGPSTPYPSAEKQMQVLRLAALAQDGSIVLL